MNAAEPTMTTIDSKAVALDRLRPGARARVVHVDGDDTIARRLADLGFWPDTVVEVVRRSPFGDPVQYRLRGFRLALRRSEARRVIVEPLGDES
ncbi:MAG: FeoA family protein [Myxococcota bacterium]